jgi:hypothetical protein
MRSSDKTRVLVFFLFFVALILFAIFYTPTNALSRPARGHDKKILSTGIAEAPVGPATR